MDNAKTFTRKSLLSVVAFVTVFSMLGLGALVPTGVSAATASDVEKNDDIKKIGVSSVFHVTDAGKKAGYSTGYAYKTWRKDFSGVLELPASTDFTQWPTDARIIHPQAGCALLTTEFTPNIYVVMPGHKVRQVADLDVMAQLYPNWEGMVYDYPEIYFAQLEDMTGSMGKLMADDMIHAGQFFMTDGVTYRLGMNGVANEIDGPESILCPVLAFDALPDEVEEVSDESMTFEEIANPDGAFGSVSAPGPDTTPVGPQGSLTFSKSANSPGIAIVPKDATHVPYLCVNASAGSEAGFIEDMTFMRYGLGDETNFDKAWLAVGGVPVTNDQSVNNDDTLLFSSMDYTVPSNSTVELCLYANLDDANSATQDGFQLKTSSSVVAGGSVSGSFPIKGSLMSYSDFEIGTATIDDRGADTDVEVGETQEIIGEFDLDFSSNNDSVGMFKHIRLKFDGSSNVSDFANVGLFEDDGTNVSESVTMWGDYVTFMIADQYEAIPDGDTRRFEVRADLIDGEDADTVFLKLDDNRDLKVIDDGAEGFGAKVVNSLNGAETSAMKTYTFDAGQFTVAKDASSPSNEEYARNTKDIVALVAKVDLGQNVTVEGLDIYLHTDSDITNGTDSATDTDDIDADIERAELFVNSKKIGTETSVTAGGAADNDDDVEADEFFYDFDSTFTLKDKDLVKLVIDLEDDADFNTYKFIFDINDFDNPEYVKSGEDVDSGNLAGSVTGNNVEISAADLTITRNDGLPANQAFVAGVNAAKFFCFLVDAGTASSVELRTINFDTNLHSDYLTANSSKFTNFNLKEVGESEPFTDLEDMNSTGSFSFTGINKTIPENGQLNVCLHGTIETGADATSTGFMFTLDASDSTIDDQEGDSISYTTDVNSQSLTVTDSGVLKVSVDADTPDATIVAAGQTVDVASWNFLAEDDDIYIKDFYVANNTTTGVANTPESNYDDRVNVFQLYANGVLLDSEAPQNGKFHFELSGANRVFVEKDEEVNVMVKAVLNSITDQSQTHSPFKLALYAVEAESASPGTDLGIQATASSGGVTTTDSSEVIAVTDTTASLDSAPTGETIVAYKSIPTLETVQLSANGNAVSFTDGDTDIFKFKVTADSKGKISWGQVTLHVTGACTGQTTAVTDCIGPNVADFTLYNSSNTEIPLTAVSSSANKIELALTTPETVGAGSSKTYRLNATLSGFADGDSIKIRLRDTTSAHVDARNLTNAKTGAFINGAFVWTDNSAGGQGTSSAKQWVIGRDIPGLDTDVQQLEELS